MPKSNAKNREFCDTNTGYIVTSYIQCSHRRFWSHVVCEMGRCVPESYSVRGVRVSPTVSTVIIIH